VRQCTRDLAAPVGGSAVDGCQRPISAALPDVRRARGALTPQTAPVLSSPLFSPRLVRPPSPSLPLPSAFPSVSSPRFLGNGSPPTNPRRARAAGGTGTTQQRREGRKRTRQQGAVVPLTRCPLPPRPLCAALAAGAHSRIRFCVRRNPAKHTSRPRTA
jgi:hypothetical protein